MPKDRRVFDRSMVSPYSCSSKISDCKNSKSSLPHVGDKKEWEEVRCPICMEHPHNAVLLLCSSHEKGCRPFICDTSYRHSNCFDQFRKSSAAANLCALSEKQQSELVCPLCRGTVTGWDVVHLTREFLNSKTRSCSLETCNFSGNYAELRKHARLEHPSGRPSEASPNRQTNWIILEEQRDVEDALLYQSDIDYELQHVWDNWEGSAADDIWDGRNPFLLDEWVGDDIWTGGSLFDFPSGMSDVEDDLSTLSGLSMPLFSPYASAHYDDVMNSGNSVSFDVDMMDSGNSGSGDEPQWAILSDSRLDFLLGNAAPSSGSGPSYHSEDGANVDDASASRSRSSYQREANSLNSRSRSGHHRENGRTILSNSSSYHRADDPVGLRARSSYSRVNDSNASRSSYSRANDSNASRSSYSRANDSNTSRSRSRYYRENSPGSSRRRSSYHRETEQHNLRSRPRPRPRFSRSSGDFVPPVRELGRRSFPGSSRQTHGRRGD